MPLPQWPAGSVHSVEQPSFSIWLPSSHASMCVPAVSWWPSPHTLMRQCAVQSRSSWFWLTPASVPRSHCSMFTPSGLKCRLTLPSPQVGVVQSRLQFAVSSATPFVPGSQVSWWVLPVLSRMPSPHTLILQFAVQSSVSIKLPSSHSSLPSRTPLPQPTPCWQSSSQPPAAPPSSQTSPRSVMPLPQVSFDLQSPEQPSGVHAPTVQSEFVSQGFASPHLPAWVLPSSQTSPLAV